MRFAQKYNNRKISEKEWTSDTVVRSYAEIGQEVQALLNLNSNSQSGSDSTVPTVILVHDEELTRNFLKQCNVDTSGWKTGLKGLLRPVSGRGPKREYDDRDDRYGGDYRARKRSRSPSYSFDSNSGSGMKYERERSTTLVSFPPGPPQTSRKAIYMVDIHAQADVLMNTSDDREAEGVQKTAKSIGLEPEEPEDEDAEMEGGDGEGDTKGICAAKEAHLLIEVWNSMAGGQAIDEQRVAVMKRTRKEMEEKQKEKEAAQGPRTGKTMYDDEDDAYDDDSGSD